MVETQNNASVHLAVELKYKMSIRKNIISILLLLIAFQLMASPAAPEPAVLTQPDGSSITVYMKGDEMLKRMETLDGYTLLYNEDGYIVYAILDEEGNLIPSDIIATDSSSLRSDKLIDLPKHLFFSKQQIEERKQLWQEETTVQPTQSAEQLRSDVIQQKRVLIVLANFRDKIFSKPKEEFEELFSQPGYAKDGAQGSVKDFFVENSYGKADVSFEVVGPVTLSQNAAYYGANNSNGNDIRTREFAAEVANKAAALVDFSQFDADNNKYVDGFHIIFAGRGEEAGGGEDCIWSHKWSFAQTLTFNGKWLQIYSCSPELYYNRITTIGAICHELTHALFGVPDYYDTDGSEGGDFEGSGNWDLMGSGSWNRLAAAGDCPAHINMYEKIRLGWLPAIELSGSQSLTNMPSSVENPQAYKMIAPADGGYFLLENKQKKGFDKALPGIGLLIWCVNAALPNYSSGINATYPQLLYPVCASSGYQIVSNEPDSYGKINTAGCPFPGTSGNTSFDDETFPSARAAESSRNCIRLFNISENAGLISFNFEDNRGNYHIGNYDETDKEGLRIFFRQKSSNGDRLNLEQLGLTTQDTIDWYTSEAWVNKISATKGMNNYETNSGVLWDNSIPNRIISVFWRARNLAGELNANRWEYLRTLYCNDNSLVNLEVDQCTKLSKVYCQNNYLRFSGMPVKNAILTTYSYAPQKKIKGEAVHFYEMIDLSKESLIDGNITTYNWYDISDGSEKYIQLRNNFGNFTLTPDLCGKRLRCKMQNAAFPEMSGSQSLVYEVDVIQPELKVYPVPTDGMLTVDKGGLPVGTIKIYDAMRRMVLETAETVFDISHLARGIYYVKVDGKTIPILR